MIITSGAASVLGAIAAKRTVTAVSLDAADTLFTAGRLWASIEQIATSYGVDRAKWRTASEHAGRAGMWPTDSPDQATRQVKWSAFFAFGIDSVLPIPADDLVDAAARAMTDPTTYELFPDSTTCLQRLRRFDARVAVVSNFDLLLYDILDFLGIRDLLDVVVTSVEVGHNRQQRRRGFRRKSGYPQALRWLNGGARQPGPLGRPPGSASSAQVPGRTTRRLHRRGRGGPPWRGSSDP